MSQLLAQAKSCASEPSASARSQYDKTLVARHFNRAANHYNQFNQLQRDVGHWLLQHAQPSASQILDVGCGPAALTHDLLNQIQGKRYIGVDLAPAMVVAAQRQYPTLEWLQADVEALPFAAAQFDLVIANLVIQWCDSPKLALRELWRMVRPGGQLLVSTVLAGSLSPLHEVWAALGSEPRQNQFESVARVAEVWQREITSDGARTSHFRAQQFSYEYEHLRDILAHLKGIGASYTARAQMGSPLTREKLLQAETYYRTRFGLQRKDSRVMLPLHWKIGVGVAIK